jgi:hypothetical protein
MNRAVLWLSLLVALPAQAAPTWRDACADADAAPRPLTRPLVARRMQALKPAAAWCFREQLRLRPDLSGTATLSLTVAEDGAVEAAVAATGFDGTPLADCLAAAARRLRFPASPGRGAVKISYPFRLHPAATPAATDCAAPDAERAAAARIETLAAALAADGAGGAGRAPRLRAIADETARLLAPAADAGRFGRLDPFGRLRAAEDPAADETARLLAAFGCERRIQRWRERAHDAHEALLAAGGAAARDPDLRYLTALLAWEAGRRAAAAGHLESLLERAPDSPHAPRARLFLALYRAETGSIPVVDAVAALQGFPSAEPAGLLAELARTYEGRAAWDDAAVAWGAAARADESAAAGSALAARGDARAAQLAAAARSGRPEALVAAAEDVLGRPGAALPAVDEALAAAVFGLRDELRDTCDPATAAAARTLAARHAERFPQSAQADSIAALAAWLGPAP